MKHQIPLVSVVICEYNTDIKYLRDAINSVLAQTYTNFELIIVDDCSSTNYSKEDFLSDPRVRVIKNKINMGLAASRNIGIDNSFGKYIAIMDTDDICHKNRLSIQVRFMEKHANVVCAGTYVKLFGNRKCKQKYSIKNTDYYRCCLLFGNSPTVTNPSVIIRSELFKNKKVRYDEQLKTAEDYDMWVQLSQNGDIKIIKKVLLDYRIRDGQMSEVFRSKDLNQYNWSIMKKQLNCLGHDVSMVGETFLRKDFKDTSIDAFSYFNFLNSLVKANQKTGFYNVVSLRKRCKQQWKQKVYSTVNQGQLKFLLSKISFSKRMQIYMWIILRPLNIIYRIINYLRTI